jgi:arogenate dehydrogenase (NADP+)
VLEAVALYRRQLESLETLVREQQWPVLQHELSECQTLRPQFL